MIASRNDRKKSALKSVRSSELLDQSTLRSGEALSFQIIALDATLPEKITQKMEAKEKCNMKDAMKDIMKECFRKNE